jgi:hypothetical protein
MGRGSERSSLVRGGRLVRGIVCAMRLGLRSVGLGGGRGVRYRCRRQERRMARRGGSHSVVVVWCGLGRTLRSGVASLLVLESPGLARRKRCGGWRCCC